MIKLHPTSTPSNPVAHILTVQGHPEFTPGIVEKVVDAREASKVFDASTTAEARRRAGGKDGSGGEGFGRVGWAIWRMMLQARPGSDLDTSEDVDMADDSKVKAYLEDDTRYSAIDMVLDRPGPWTDEQFVGGAEVSCDQTWLKLGEKGAARNRQDSGHWSWRTRMRTSAEPGAECVEKRRL